jgi:RNA polymerase sigma factor (sigma-70 family)
MTNLHWPQQVAAWAEEWHGDLLKFLVRRMSVSADAQDVAQEVYLRLLRVDRLDVIRRPRSYLLRIAANVLHEWRLQARWTQQMDRTLEEVPSDDDLEHHTASMLRGERLWAEVSHLPMAPRIALILHTRDELTYEQIAIKMDVTPRMVKRYLLSAFARLRERLPTDM